jgi:signal peptidase I
MRTWFRMIFWVLGVAGAVLLVLYLGFFDVWTVPSDDPLLSAAIEPTLTAGDVVVLTRRTDVSRGDLLRCNDPQAPGRFVIARAISKFGDTLTLAAESVSIDGHRTPSPRACEPPSVVLHDPQSNEDVSLACSVEEYGDMNYDALRSMDHPEAPTKATVEAGKWFLVSDDRHIHLDSRDFGQVEPNQCKHIVFRIVSAAGFFADGKRRLQIIW